MYIGSREVIFNDEELSEFYSYSPAARKLYIERGTPFMPNEYVILKNTENSPIDYFRVKGDNLIPIKFPIIESEMMGKIKPRNDRQKLAIDLLKNKDIGVKILAGCFGSGKDYLMSAQALSYVEKGVFQKIVFIRPNVVVKDVPDIGYLKGDAMEKLSWTLGPLYDKVGGEDGVQMMIGEGRLELVPLPFIRGRSFEDSIVYVCEGQNITTSIAKLLISRIGEGSELWINGDTKQTDNKLYERDNGIETMIEKLKDDELFGMVYLDKTERSKIANLANKLDD